jgi:hypothetical protein
VSITSATNMRMVWMLRSALGTFLEDEYGVDAAAVTAWTGVLEMPTAIQPVWPALLPDETDANASYVYMASVANLNSSTLVYQTAVTDNGYISYSSGGLFAAGDEYLLEIDPIRTYLASATVVDTANRRVRGLLRCYDKRGQRTTTIPDVLVPFSGTTAARALIGEHTFFQGLKVASGSWVYGLYRGIINDTILAGSARELDIDSRDWSTMTAADDATSARYLLETANDTPHVLRAREWRLNGEQNLKDLVEECCQFAGSALSLRRSKLMLRPFRPPLRSDVTDTAHTLSVTSGTIVGKVGWQRNRDVVANVGQFTIGDEGRAKMTWNVLGQRSKARFGTQRQVKIKVRGITVTADVIQQGPTVLAAYFMRRIEALWGTPVASITVAMPRLDFLDTIEMLDTVSLTHWLPPNASGTRALSSAKALVVGKNPDPRTGMMTMTLMRWPQYAQTSGFAPCCRVSSISGAVLTIAVDYANSTDYAGSDQSGYANSTRGTVANDGGVGYFVAGQKVELVERKNTNPRTPDSYTIDSINTATPSITLTTSPDAAWQTIITGVGVVDVRFDDYATSGLTSAQKDWCWIGARATRVIGGTTDDRFRWAP